MKQSYKEFLQEEFNFKVYNALSDVAFEFCDVSDELNKECMKKAIERFMARFYEVDSED